MATDTAHRYAQRPVLELSGEIDIANAMNYLSEGKRLLDLPGTDGLVLDVHRVRFLDSAGLALLLSLRRHAVHVGADFTVRGPGRRTRELFAMTGLTALDIEA